MKCGVVVRRHPAEVAGNGFVSVALVANRQPGPVQAAFEAFRRNGHAGAGVKTNRQAEEKFRQGPGKNEVNTEMAPVFGDRALTWHDNVVPRKGPDRSLDEFNARVSANSVFVPAKLNEGFGPASEKPADSESMRREETKLDLERAGNAERRDSSPGGKEMRESVEKMPQTDKEAFRRRFVELNEGLQKLYREHELSFQG